MIMKALRWLYYRVGYFLHIHVSHGHERYIKRFGNRISQEGLEYIMTAYRMAKEIHRGDDVTRYFEHDRDVGNIISIELAIKHIWEINETIKYYLPLADYLIELLFQSLKNGKKSDLMLVGILKKPY